MTTNLTLTLPWGRSMATRSPQTSTCSDEERALTGDREAWERLFRAHGRRVEVALLAKGVPLQAARDATQAAWLKMLEQVERGTLKELRLPAYAITLARNLSIDAWRKGRFESPTADGAVLERRLSGATDLQELAISRQQLDCMRSRLETCSARKQRIFARRFADAWQARQIAEAEGMSVQRVRQSLSELRARLRECREEAP